MNVACKGLATTVCEDACKPARSLQPPEALVAFLSPTKQVQGFLQPLSPDSPWQTLKWRCEISQGRESNEPPNTLVLTTPTNHLLSPTTTSSQSVL